MTPVSEDDARGLREIVTELEDRRVERDALIAKLMDEGASAREVAALAGISHTWVLKIWKDQT